MYPILPVFLLFVHACYVNTGILFFKYLILLSIYSYNVIVFLAIFFLMLTANVYMGDKYLIEKDIGLKSTLVFILFLVIYSYIAISYNNVIMASFMITNIIMCRIQILVFISAHRRLLSY